MRGSQGRGASSFKKRTHFFFIQVLIPYIHVSACNDRLCSFRNLPATHCWQKGSGNTLIPSWTHAGLFAEERPEGARHASLMLRRRRSRGTPREGKVRSSWSHETAAPRC